jgi:hypothetical protein
MGTRKEAGTLGQSRVRMLLHVLRTAIYCDILLTGLCRRLVRPDVHSWDEIAVMPTIHVEHTRRVDYCTISK